jgi:hypothetical protein
MMSILIIALIVMMVVRSGERWHRRGPSLAESRLADLQQQYVQSLEERVMRLEEGLDFAERMLANK